jgi:hypothetical protein
MHIDDTLLHHHAGHPTATGTQRQDRSHAMHVIGLPRPHDTTQEITTCARRTARPRLPHVATGHLTTRGAIMITITTAMTTGGAGPAKDIIVALRLRRPLLREHIGHLPIGCVMGDDTKSARCMPPVGTWLPYSLVLGSHHTV